MMRIAKNFSHLVYSLSYLLLIVACSHLEPPSVETGATEEKQPASERKQPLALEHVIPELEAYRAVLVGELHDRYDHHLNQLAVIKSLYSQSPDLVIAMEFFQTPFQDSLDAYIAGDINEQEMLQQTEYFSRWGYDYRLYAPIMQFARKNRIPLLALNVPTEITRQTARTGLDSLDPSQQQLIPKTLDRSNADYNERILSVFAMHGTMVHGLKAQNFLDAQLLWDEGMAERAADYLIKNPERKMVLLAGIGHIAYRDGIPDRLERRLKLPVVTLMNAAEDDDLDDTMADFFIKTQQQKLSSTGALGVNISEDAEGLYVHSLDKFGAASVAGILPGDRIERLQGRQVDSCEDVKLVVWNSKPGDIISIDATRASSNDQPLQYRLKLQ